MSEEVYTKKDVNYIVRTRVNKLNSKIEQLETEKELLKIELDKLKEVNK